METKISFEEARKLRQQQKEDVEARFLAQCAKEAKIRERMNLEATGFTKDGDSL